MAAKYSTSSDSSTSECENKDGEESDKVSQATGGLFSQDTLLEMRDILVEDLADISPLLFDQDEIGYTIPQILAMKARMSARKRAREALLELRQRHDSEHEQESNNFSKGSAVSKLSKGKRPLRRTSEVNDNTSDEESTSGKPRKRTRKRACLPFSSPSCSSDLDHHTSSSNSGESGGQCPIPAKRRINDDSEEESTNDDGESCVSTSDESESDREPTANVVSLDCETVGCVPNEEWRKHANPLSGRKKSKRMENNLALVAAHCAIVDYNYRTLYETYISTDMTIVEYRSISPKNLRNGKPFKEAREEILSLLKGKVVVVHDAQKDMRYLQISHNDIPYSNVRDTATCPLLHKKAKDAGKAVGVPTASLRQLARGVLNKGIHRKGPHSPVEDAKVAMELYRCVEEEWERSYAKCSIPMSLTVGLTLHLAYNCSCLL